MPFIRVFTASGTTVGTRSRKIYDGMRLRGILDDFSAIWRQHLAEIDTVLALDFCDEAELKKAFLELEESLSDCEKVCARSILPFFPCHGFELTLDDSTPDIRW